MVVDGHAHLGHFLSSLPFRTFPRTTVSIADIALRRGRSRSSRGTPRGMPPALVKRLRERAKEGTNQLFVTAAPPCPFPDASISQALNDHQYQIYTILRFLAFFVVTGTMFKRNG